MKRTHKTDDGMLVVKATLPHYRGNALPHFSIVATQYEFDKYGTLRDAASGCLHTEILAAMPDLAPLVALHLSDVDGVPMHALANAWYHAGGHKEYPDARKESVLMNHLRIGQQEAVELMDLAAQGLRAIFNARVEAMRPRWKSEAVAAIAAWDLVPEVTG